MDDYVQELAEVAKVVNQLAKMSAADYAAQLEDNKSLDSIFYGAIEQYIEFGVPREQIEANPDIKAVDMERSKRIHEEYIRNHLGGR